MLFCSHKLFKIVIDVAIMYWGCIAIVLGCCEWVSGRPWEYKRNRNGQCVISDSDCTLAVPEQNSPKKLFHY